MIGIYKITNVVTNKKYIGSSILSVEKRIKIHKCKLKKGNHHSNKLQNSYNKYGEINFIFEQIEECCKENCIEREQYYIDYYDSYLNGYNCLPTAGSNKGMIVTKETRIKISKKLKGIIPAFTKEQKLKGIESKTRGVLQYNNNNILINTFKNQKEASNFLKISQSKVSEICNFKADNLNFKLRFKNEPII